METDLPRAGKAVCAAAAVLLLAVSAVAAPKNNNYALLFGTVWTADQRPAPGVKVKIRRADDKPTKARWELVSDARGEFAQRVPAEKADYVIWAERKGSKGPAAETKVHVDYDERQDIGLHLTE